MRFVVGTTLGPYEIVAPLGAGGMGEVYRARDSRLGRDVAIKILPAQRFTDEGRRRRFVREARAASKLNHPNVVTIHEIEAAEGIDFIVMEYVPGQPLAARIPANGMPLDQALRVAIPIADALAAAHASGIVHRDLKPANVVVTQAGVVKVLDFGLAKLVHDEEDDTADTRTATAVERGISKEGTRPGTPAYMSPEQSVGGTVDARSDIFSFGAVLYEMVTGRRAFAGKSTSETLTAVVKDQPPAPRELAPGIPEALERIILRCLRKDPARRFQQMADVKIELEELKEDYDSQGSSPGRPAHRPPDKSRWLRWSAAGLVILAAVATAMMWRTRGDAAPAPVVVQLSSERWAGSGSFSPDGTQIAYASAGEDGINWDIWLKIVGQAEARRLTTDPAAEGYPAWSPDGTQIAFLRYYAGQSRGITEHATGIIHVMSALGGAERKLSDFPARLQLAWSVDGRWLVASKARSGSDLPGGIYIISLATGEARALTTPKPLTFDVSPALSPDGRTLAYASCRGGSEGAPFCDVYVQSVNGELRPQDGARLVPRPRAIGAPGLSWARDGRSIVCDGLLRLRVDGGPPERLDLAAGGRQPSSASHRDRLAFVRNVDGSSDVYRLTLGGTPTPLFQSVYSDAQPRFSPDGARVAFASQRGGIGSEIWVGDATGSNVRQLTRGPGLNQGTPGWSPDGLRIVFDSRADDGHPDVWVIDASGSGLRQMTHDPGDDRLPSWSRDGRFIYFVSNRSGREEVWRTPTGGAGPDEQITRNGGSFPLESVDGRTLYYKATYGDGALLSRPTGGSAERKILPCVSAFGYDVANGGLLFNDCGSLDAGASPKRTLRFWDETTGKIRPVATVEADWIGGLTVSSDGRHVVYGRGTATSDLMMIDNFR